jgi:PLP dependent protein
MIKVNVNKISQETNNVNIVAVSKRKSVQLIKDAIDAGIKIIGENQIQEAQQKYNELKDYFKQNNVEFHFIGHLQTNKVKKAVLMFDLIQTVDSIKLANEINKRALKINKIQDILIQINIGNEIQKYGIKKEEIFDFLKEIKQLKNINVKGLMCIHPYEKDPKPYFKEMKTIFDQTKLEILSMGMSSDYKLAIEEGSNMVRIGTKIFGDR